MVVFRMITVESILKTSYSAHKISFWIHSEYQTPKDIPGSNEDGEIMVIRHLCGNSRCVNPEHFTTWNWKRKYARSE